MLGVAIENILLCLTFTKKLLFAKKRIMKKRYVMNLFLCEFSDLIKRVLIGGKICISVVVSLHKN